MKITVKRLTINRLYTEGQLLINHTPTTHTVESTELMLPPGHYIVRLTKTKDRRRVIAILPTSLHPRRPSTPTTSIGIGQSWIASRKHHVIAIGQPLIPGAVYKATEVYERLFDRIEKCEARKELIHLTITEHGCRENHPISHWCRLQVKSEK